MIKHLKLNLIKKSYNSNINNELSNLLVKSLVKNDNLKKITWTSKTIENENNIKPYLSYTTNDTEYKIYDDKSINKFLDQFNYDNTLTSIIYNEMMESKI